MMIWRGVLLLAAGAIAFAQSDAEIRRVLSERKTTGMIAGVIGPDGSRRVVVQGEVQPESLFEIGSITKVFTALLLADMVERGEVSLSDPIAKYLPAEVVLPSKTRGITLAQLATNMSGLPRLPSGMSPANIADPYADYTAERLYAFLRSYELPRDPGSKWEYSNVGFGLLGHLLALRADSDYETMTRLRMCGPLDMTDTWIRVPGFLTERLARGHSVQLLPVGYWNFTDAMAGAGAFRSDIHDMLEFLAAAMGQKDSGLAPAMAATLRPRVETGVPGFGQALGWNTSTNGGREIVWKDGGTLGFSSFIGFDPKRRVGMVVLSNNGGPGPSQAGLKLLRESQ